MLRKRFTVKIQFLVWSEHFNFDKLLRLTDCKNCVQTRLKYILCFRKCRYWFCVLITGRTQIYSCPIKFVCVKCILQFIQIFHYG